MSAPLPEYRMDGLRVVLLGERTVEPRGAYARRLCLCGHTHAEANCPRCGAAPKARGTGARRVLFVEIADDGAPRSRGETTPGGWRTLARRTGRMMRWDGDRYVPTTMGGPA